MPDDDDFEPRPGHIRNRGAGNGPKFLHQVFAAANLARGGSPLLSRRKSGFGGSRIGRGAGVGRVLAARDRFAAFRQRRVIIKSRIVRLSGKDLANARAHLRYVQRDGVTRGGTPGELYGAAQDRVDSKAFLERGSDDRHQFRFIVSAEDGDRYDDIKPLTRRLMARMEEDLGTRLDWVAVDHFNTGHPHSHIILRGRDDRGRDLVIARDYLTQGMRERAADLVQLDLGPRTDPEIEARLRAEVGQERLTTIDRRLIATMDEERKVVPHGRDVFRQSLAAGRLRKLERMGLAREINPGRWRLASDLEATLRRIGERGDILRTMHRELAAHGVARAAGDRLIFDPAGEARPIVGRVVARGLADEINDRHYLLVDATDGRSHYVDIGRSDAVEALPDGAIVQVVPRTPTVRPVDCTIAAVAAASGGRYDIDAHLRHDPQASQAFAETHVRRLEAMRRVLGNVERCADGSWVIASDHLERAAAFEARQTRDRPVEVQTLSPLPLSRLATYDGPTWLDKQLVADPPEALRDAGFGGEMRAALAQRRQWLIDRQLADEVGQGTRYRPGLLATLQRRELLRIAGQLSDELGLGFAETRRGERIEGIFRRSVDLAGGRYAVIQKSKEFTLVPWRPVLEQQLGKPVAGVMRDGAVSWTLARQRSGPSIS